MTFRREYLGTWHDDKTLRIDLDNIRTLADVDRLRGHSPERIVFSGSIRNPLSQVARYLTEILDTMLANGASVVTDDGPEGIHVTIHDVPEGVTCAQLRSALHEMRPSVVHVDTAGPTHVLLTYLQHDGINAKALPKGPRQ